MFPCSLENLGSSVCSLCCEILWSSITCIFPFLQVPIWRLIGSCTLEITFLYVWEHFFDDIFHSFFHHLFGILLIRELLEVLWMCLCFSSLLLFGVLDLIKIFCLKILFCHEFWNGYFLHCILWSPRTFHGILWMLFVRSFLYLCNVAFSITWWPSLMSCYSWLCVCIEGWRSTSCSRQAGWTSQAILLGDLVPW